MRRQYIKFFIALFLTAVFLVPLETYAQTGWVLEQVGNAFFSSIVGWVLSLIGGVLAFIMELFDWMLQASMGFYDAPVVDAGWGIMRDFANMFFIVALIIMAFGTIFEVSGYDFRKMIVRFLFAAVGINFSLAICRLYLQMTDAVSHVFLTAIGDASGQIGQGLSLTSTLPDPSILGNLGSIGSGLVTATLTGIFGIIFLGGLTLTMGTAFAFIFVRIPILWYLMIFAPIAIIMSVFPTTKKNFDTWYNMMLGWGMFLPIFLFFLYFGVYFLSRQGELVATIKAGTEIPGGVPFQTVFSFALVWIFVIGGLKTAYKMSMFASTHVVEWTNRPGAWVGKRTGWTGAWQARKKQWQEEGVRIGGRKIWGGEQDRTRREAWIAGKLGVRGQDLKYQQAFVDQTSKSYNDLETKYRLGQLGDRPEEKLKELAKGGSATNPEVYAARKMLAKIGQLDDSTTKKTFSELKNNALAQEDFAKTASSAKWSELESENLRAIAKGGVVHKRDRTGTITATYDYSEMGSNVNSVGARREAVKSLKDNKKAIAAFDSVATSDEFKKYIDLLGGPTTYEGREFVKAIGNLRPDLIYDLYSTDPTRYKSLNTVPLSRADMIKNAVVRADAETLVNMPHAGLWADPSFQTVLTNKYMALKTSNNKAQFKTRLVEELAKGVPDAGLKTAIVNALP